MDSPETDELHKRVRGEWDRCYHEMHIHATKLEYRLTKTIEENQTLKDIIKEQEDK
jgi:hypothetical protein